MTELMRNARLGWESYTENGKLAALFLAALLFLWLRRSKTGHKSLLLYAAAAAACCMIPLTAAVLMLYQTKFYDYEWVWSMVPLTAVTAWGAAEFLGDYWTGFQGKLWKRGVPVTLLLLAAVLFCSGLGGQVWNREQEMKEREEAGLVLEELRELAAGREICLWAPQTIMEYARELDGSIRLIYGRNMWDISLNGYAYDVYEEPVQELYRFMEQNAGEVQTEDGEEKLITVRQCADIIMDRGVNCILLPQTADAGMVEQLEDALGLAAGQLGEYYLFIL